MTDRLTLHRLFAELSDIQRCERERQNVEGLEKWNYALWELDCKSEVERLIEGAMNG